MKGDGSMHGKRKHRSAEFKAYVSLAALSGGKTLAELTSEYKVHLSQFPPGSNRNYQPV